VPSLLEVKTGMGESETLAKALEKLAELLTNKSDGAGSVGGGAIVPHVEAVQKLELMPNKIKLEGVTNYLRWSRRAMWILKTKWLDEHVSSGVAVVEPTGKTSPKWKKWSATNSLIVAWMLLVHDIAASVEALTKALEVWDTLSNILWEREHHADCSD
jgi:hypothetical protein